MLTSRNEAVKTLCPMCPRLCGMLAHVRDGRVVKVEGDPEDTQNMGSLCPKAFATVEMLYHPARLKHPLKRAGSRGEGQWQRITWDEALDTIAQAMESAKADYGAESVAFVSGSGDKSRPYINRLCNVFGTPNKCSVNHVCAWPRSVGSQITYGMPTVAPREHWDLDYPPACVILWGANLSGSHPFQSERLEHVMSEGTKLIVVDPRETRHASRADVWLQPRPATDLALVLGMIHVIVTERLYDESFVDAWTVGFDELVEHVQDYTPHWAEQITWVPADKIRIAARMYSEIKPATIRPGNGIDDTINSVQTSRAISILRAITGNVAIPGGDGDWSLLPNTREGEFILSDVLSTVQHQKMLGTERKPGADGDALPQLVAKAILKEKPYPVKVMCIHGSNPLLTWSNAEETYSALMKLDFLSVADLVMTPSAELADIVLPVTSFLEVDDVVFSPPRIKVRRRVVEPIGECWPDRKIMNELAKRLGLGRYFWNDVEESLDVRLKPAGCTFAELKKIGTIKASRVYRNYEKSGFNTPSGKAEIYSSLLEEWGHDPLPTYREPPETPRSAPELSEEYPLILTSCHSPFYYHSADRHLSTLRCLESEPCMEIHPKTAVQLGIRDGDLVYIETQRGRIQQRATITEGIDPRVVNVRYAWWFPEQGIETLHGWRESNINILTDSAPPYNPEVGSTNLRGILCRVYKEAP